MARNEEKKKKFSLLDPDGASAGLLDNFKATIVKSRYVDGKDTVRAKDFKDEVVGMLINYELEDGSGHEDFLIAANKLTKAGAPLWEVSDDGLTLIPQQSEDQTLWKGAEVIIYMERLLKAGFTKSALTDEADCIEGVSAVFKREDIPGRKKNDKGYAPQVLGAVEGTLSMPGGKGAKSTAKGSSVKGAGASKKAAAEPAEDADDATAKAVEYIKAALEEAGGKLTTKELEDAVFTAATTDKLARALKNEINEIVGDADKLDELGSENGWTVNAKRGIVIAD